MTLERIVRPFQTGDVTPPRRYQPSDGSSASPADNVLFQPGKIGSAKTFTGTTDFTQTYYLDTRNKEKKPTGA